MEITGEEGEEGLHGMEGWGGLTMMTNSSLMWQMSPEESTKDAKNWKN